MDSPSSEWLPPSGPIDDEFGQAGGDKPTGNQWKTSCLVGGIPTPLKNMDVNWDDEILNVWKKIPNHQPVIVL